MLYYYFLEDCCDGFCYVAGGAGGVVCVEGGSACASDCWVGCEGRDGGAAGAGRWEGFAGLEEGRIGDEGEEDGAGGTDGAVEVVRVRVRKG